MDQTTISSDSDSDASMFASSTTTNRHPQSQSHHHYHHYHHHTHHPTIPTTSSPSTNTTTTIPDKRKSTTHRTHETIHISNTILSSKELLLLHSLAANESVPRTRRRFLAQVVEPDDPSRALKLLYDRTSTPGARGEGGGGGGTAAVVGGLKVAAGDIVDVVDMDDENGWERLRVRKSKSAGGGLSSPMARKTSSSSSPGGSKKGLQSRRVVSGSMAASRSGSPLASPAVRRGGRRGDGEEEDVDMDIY